MRPYKAYLTLLARTSLVRLLLLVVVAAAVELALFWPAMERSLSPTPTHVGGYYSLAGTIGESRIRWVVPAAMAAAYVLLSLSGRERGADRSYLKQSYTLRRLDLSHRGRYFTQATYKSFCFLLLWAAQAAILWGLCALYTARAEPHMVSGQTVLLAFFDDQLLRRLLPMGEPVLWAANLLLVLLLGFDCAMLSMGGLLTLPLLALLIPMTEVGGVTSFLAVTALCLLLCILFGIRKEVVYERQETGPAA